MAFRIASKYLAPRSLASRCQASIRCTPSLISPPLLRPYPSLPRNLQPIAHRFAHSIPRPAPSAQPSSSETKTRKQLEPHYQLTFTCVPCGNRSSHTVSKQGYHRGSVLITCPDCRNRHVISDNLNIFGDRKITVEDLLREKGQLVKRGTLGEDGDIEFWQESTADSTEARDAVDNKVSSGTPTDSAPVKDPVDARFDGFWKYPQTDSRETEDANDDEVWSAIKSKLNHSMESEASKDTEVRDAGIKSANGEVNEPRETPIPSSKTTHPTAPASALSGDTRARPSVQETGFPSHTPSTRRQYHVKKFVPPKGLQEQDALPIDTTKQEAKYSTSNFELHLDGFRVTQKPGSGTRRFIFDNDVASLRAALQEQEGGYEHKLLAISRETALRTPVDHPSQTASQNDASDLSPDPDSMDEFEDGLDGAHDEGEESTEEAKVRMVNGIKYFHGPRKFWLLKDGDTASRAASNDGNDKNVKPRFVYISPKFQQVRFLAADSNIKMSVQLQPGIALKTRPPGGIPPEKPLVPTPYPPEAPRSSTKQRGVMRPTCLPIISAPLSDDS